MQYEDLKAKLETVKGTTFAGLDTITNIKLKGGKKNPHQDRVTKRTTGANVILFSNVEHSPYVAMVKRRMEQEGKDPSEFEAKPRAWGSRVGKTPFIEHKDKYYLEVIFRSPGKSEYFLDGKPIAKEDIEGLEVEKSETAQETEAASQGGIEEKIVIRTFAIENIEQIRLLGESIS